MYSNPGTQLGAHNTKFGAVSQTGLTRELFRLRRKLLLKVFNSIQHSSDLVFFKAVLREGELRDDTKNGCAADQH